MPVRRYYFVVQFSRGIASTRCISFTNSLLDLLMGSASFIYKGFLAAFKQLKKSRDWQRKAHQEEIEAVKRKPREADQSKLRDPPSQVSSPSAGGSPNLRPGNSSSLFQSPPPLPPNKSQTKPSVDLSGPRTNSSMMFPSQMTREQMAQLLQLQQNQLTLLQMQYGQDNPGLPLFL